MKITQEMKRSGVTVLFAVWMILIAVHEGREVLRRHAVSPQRPGARIINKWETLMASRVPILGTPSADFKIVEFSDYQCPFCRMADPVLARFAAHHRNDVVVYRYDMPLQEVHRYAYAAALAANCAELQGIREPYQSLLFQHQQEFATLNWTALAKEGGITNTDSFAQCIRDDIPRDRIRRDLLEAESLKIQGTPSFIVNGELLSEGISDDKLESLYKNMNRNHRGVLNDLFSW